METLVELVQAGDWQPVIDSTILCGHARAAGTNVGSRHEDVDRSGGGFTSKVFARTKSRGRSLVFILSGNEGFDFAAVP